MRICLACWIALVFGCTAGGDNHAVDQATPSTQGDSSSNLDAPSKSAEAPEQFAPLKGLISRRLPSQWPRNLSQQDQPASPNVKSPVSVPPTPTHPAAIEVKRDFLLVQKRGQKHMATRLKQTEVRNKRSASWFDLAQQAGAEAMRKRRPQWRIEHSVAWMELISDIKKHTPNHSQDEHAKRSVMIQLLDVALRALNSQHSFDRSAGYLLTRFVMTSFRTKTLSESQLNPYLEALAAQYAESRPEEERRVLIKSLRKHAGPHLRGFLAWVAMIDPDEQTRVEALTGLAECVKASTACRPKPEIIDVIYRRHTDHRTRQALFIYAGYCQHRPVLKWCADRLTDGAAALACRTAMSKYAQPESFERLASWIEKQMYTPDSLLPGSYGFRDDFSYLMPYGNLDFSGDRYFSLLEKVLLQTERSGYATGVIVRSLKNLKNRRRVRSLLAKVTGVYRKRFGTDPSLAADAFLMAALRQAAVDVSAKYQPRD